MRTHGSRIDFDAQLINSAIRLPGMRVADSKNRCCSHTGKVAPHDAGAHREIPRSHINLAIRDAVRCGVRVSTIVDALFWRSTFGSLVFLREEGL
jgi:hypothetical protein